MVEILRERKFVDRLIGLEFGVAGRNGDYLVVFFAGVKHRHKTNRSC